MFMQTLHGQVYARVSSLSLSTRSSDSQLTGQSQLFEILTATPSNYTTVTGQSLLTSQYCNAEIQCTETDRVDYPTATRTATLDHFPNPTQEWAITLDGSDPDASRTATATASIVGNVGS